MNSSEISNFLYNFNAIVDLSCKIAMKLEQSWVDYIKDDLQKEMEKNGVIVKKIYIFGPRISGLGAENSNLQISLQIDNFNSGNLFNKVLGILRSSPYFDYKNHEHLITNASVTLRHYTGIDCEIKFNEMNGYYKMYGLKQWLKLQEPELRKFLLFLRNLFEYADLQDVKLDDALEMMAIYFLQVHGYLPSFKGMQKDRYKRTCIEFLEKKLEDYGHSTMIDYRSLVRSFLSYYAKFNFAGYIVCPYLGSDVKRLEFSFRADLIVHTERFSLNMARPMVVLDFVDLTKNYADQVTNVHLFKFQMFCQQMYSYFSSYPGFY